MAYHAQDDTFLPSWGSGMRPREPVDPYEESFSGFEDYPPKPKKLWTPPVAVPETQMDQLTTYGAMANHGMQATPYGTMTDKGTEKLQHTPKYRRIERFKMAEKSLFLLWWPAFLGVCIVASFGLGYWHHSWAAHIILTLSVLVGFTMITIGANGGWTNKASMTFMMTNGFCIIFIAMVSVILGVCCFQMYTKSYEVYRGSRYYENIMPSSNPGQYRDAGVIEFAPGSTVDVAHSIGLRNGDMYCVAPIVNPDSNGHSGSGQLA